MRDSLSLLLRTAALAVLLLQPGAAGAQERWQWPERAEDLQVLPPDTGPDELRNTMFGFTRALGVRCSHCHLGEEGQPLSTYDFVSTENPNKVRAREMLRMVRSIEEHLAEIESSGESPVAVSCGTCHSGRARPQPLLAVLHEAYREGGAEAALARHGELWERYYGRGAYDFGEGTLNSFGYRLLLAEEDVDGALAVFHRNAELFPESANVWDSLAEAYLRAGRHAQAEVFYRKSLELDPGNDNAVAKLEELRSGPAEPADSEPGER